MGEFCLHFRKSTMEEATTILDCLPLVIQHEMHLDPPCFLTDLFIKNCRGNYYNPLTRTGMTAVAACLEDEIKIVPNPKKRIPTAIQSASAEELEHIFKRKENKMFSFPIDSDLASLAESLASYQLPDKGLPRNMPKISDLQKLLQTHHLSPNKDEEVSVLSDSSSLSFDSKTSRNRFEIERRADQMANKKVNDSIYQLKIKQGLNLLKTGVLTPALAETMELPYDDIMKIHSDNKNDQLETHKIPQKDNTDSLEVTKDDHPPSNTNSDTDNKVQVQGIELTLINDDPLNQVLPDSDMSEGGESAETQIRGSPNKQLAPGGHNAGSRK
jgi:hypothetical protein